MINLKYSFDYNKKNKFKTKRYALNFISSGC